MRVRIVQAPRVSWERHKLAKRTPHKPAAVALRPIALRAESDDDATRIEVAKIMGIAVYRRDAAPLPGAITRENDCHVMASV